MHLDETGLRTAGKTMWVHTMSSSRNTHLFISEHRGGEAIKVHLEGYEGTQFMTVGKVTKNLIARMDFATRTTSENSLFLLKFNIKIGRGNI